MMPNSDTSSDEEEASRSARTFIGHLDAMDGAMPSVEDGPAFVDCLPDPMWPGARAVHVVAPHVHPKDMLPSAPPPSSATAGASTFPGAATGTAVVVAEPSFLVMFMAAAAVNVLRAPATSHTPCRSLPSATLTLVDERRGSVAVARHCEPGVGGVSVALAATDSKLGPPS